MVSQISAVDFEKERIETQKKWPTINFILTKNNSFTNVARGSDKNTPNKKGELISWFTSRRLGFVGTQKFSRQANLELGLYMAKKINTLKTEGINLAFIGANRNRRPILRGLRKGQVYKQKKIGFIITKMRFPFNGCKLKKPRRI